MCYKLYKPAAPVNLNSAKATCSNDGARILLISDTLVLVFAKRVIEERDGAGNSELQGRIEGERVVGPL